MEKIGIKKLAKELNLSISTVSRALNNSHEVGFKTREKVFDLVKKLNYQPHPSASSLREQKTRTIAVVIPDVANNFFYLAINGAESVAAEKNYHVLIYLTHENHEKEAALTRKLSGGRVDGILVSVSCDDDLSHLHELSNKGIPMVFFDRAPAGLNHPTVTTDDYESSFKATEHLVENGCKRIAHFSVLKNMAIGTKRRAGYQDALRKHHIRESLVLDCSNDEEHCYRQIRNFIRDQQPDGIFASVEKLTIQSYYACRELGLSIPEKMKIIGFSNLQTATLLHPPLTTITQPAFEIGQEAMRVLFSQIEKQEIAEREIILKSTLCIRSSTKK